MPCGYLGREATNEVGGSYVGVDTGPSMFGKKVLSRPGCLVTSIPMRKRRVTVVTVSGTGPPER
jgi:hypothetical protein